LAHQGDADIDQPLEDPEEAKKAIKSGVGHILKREKERQEHQTQ